MRPRVTCRNCGELLPEHDVQCPLHLSRTRLPATLVSERVTKVWTAHEIDPRDMEYALR